MNGKYKTAPFVLMGVLIAAAIIGGVGILQQQGILGGWSSTGQSGILAAQITDPPNVPAGVTNVYITYTDVKVHYADAGNQSGWETIANSGQVDLMSVLSVRETLGSALVQSGKYNLVRLDIASAEVTYNGVNYSAYVPANKITVPITGGAWVHADSSTGFVIDISPTVVPYQIGTGFGFVLVPAARGIPVPQLNWHESDDQQGARDDLTGDSWWHQNEVTLTGNLTIQSATLTNSSLSLLLKNIGTSNITLNAISILGSSPIVSGQITSIGTESTLTPDITATSTISEVSTTTTESHDSTSGTSSDIEQEFTTIAEFQVLDNGTLLQPNGELEIPDHVVGLVIQPGQSVTLTYQGPIVTFHHEIPQYRVTSGLMYHIAALGEFDTAAYFNVTAS